MGYLDKGGFRGVFAFNTHPGGEGEGGGGEVG